VRSGGGEDQVSQQLTNAAGEVTSHLQGMFYRTIRMLTHGIKPCFVFDGKPPELKGGELAKRKENREKAAEELKKAEDADNKEDIDKYNRRLVRVSKQENEDCKQLLILMGVPIVEAPGEAEAQCASMCKDGLVYAVATEDMDALTFGAPVLVRHMTFSEARKEPIIEFNLATVLDEMGMTQTEFIDLCILCGCDYTNTIRGIGPFRAYELIKKHKSIAEAIKHIDKEKNPYVYFHFHRSFLHRF
jgi:flap endonuclease-1